MPTPGLGLKSYIQLKPEAAASYGTPATGITNRQEIISANIAPVKGVIQDPSLNNSPSRRGIFEGGTSYKGTIVTRMNFEGQEELFRAVFGTYLRTASGESTFSDHTFTENARCPSYTIELILGDIPAGNAFRLVGAKFTGLTVRGTAGQGADAMLQCEWTVLAKDMSPVAVTAGNVPPTVRPVIFHSNNNPGGGVIVDNGIEDLSSNIRVRSFEVTLENPHAEDRFYLSSTQIDEPVRNDFLTARWRFTEEFTSVAEFNAIRTWASVGSEPSPRLLFQGGKINDPAGTQRFEFELRSNKAQYTEWSAPVEGYGIVTSTATLEAFFNSTDNTALLARVRNSLVSLASLP